MVLRVSAKKARRHDGQRQEEEGQDVPRVRRRGEGRHARVLEHGPVRRLLRHLHHSAPLMFFWLWPALAAGAFLLVACYTGPILTALACGRRPGSRSWRGAGGGERLAGPDYGARSVGSILVHL